MTFFAQFVLETRMELHKIKMMGCPFCGGRPGIGHHIGDGHPRSNDEGMGIAISCRNCKATIVVPYEDLLPDECYFEPGDFDENDLDQEKAANKALKLWNTRV